MQHYYWLIIILLIAPKAYAQDTQYWTQQFGSRSALMSGAVVGGSDDNTMVYYNPGALGFMEDASISINANVYRIENIRIFNALGQEADFKSSQIASVPLLAGGMLKTKKDKWKIGYAIISPVNFSFKGTARVDGEYELIDDNESPGMEALVGESSITSKLSDVMLGIGVGRALNDHWSVGLTHLFSVRSQVYQRNFSAHMFLNDDTQTQVGASRVQNVDYFNVRYMAKLGVAYRRGGWSFGFTLTTPSVRILGNGTVAADVSVHNYKINGTDRDDGVASDRQEKLKSTYKSPLTVAGGINYAWGRSILGVTLQYYGNIENYDILRAEPAAFVRPPELYPNLGSDEFLRVRSAARPVLNIALGYEYLLNENVSLITSLRNDMTYYKDPTINGRGIDTIISSWDIYHFVTGATISRERSSLSIGLLLSMGTNNEYEQDGNLGNIPEGNILDGSTTITQANYFSVGVLLGYTFNFKKF